MGSNFRSTSTQTACTSQALFFFFAPAESKCLPRPIERHHAECQIETILRGVTQQRQGVIGVESYYQYLLNPQALQFDTREDELDILYFSDYDTGYIYKVTGMVAMSALLLPLLALLLLPLSLLLPSWYRRYRRYRRYSVKK